MNTLENWTISDLVLPVPGDIRCKLLLCIIYFQILDTLIYREPTRSYQCHNHPHYPLPILALSSHFRLLGLGINLGSGNLGSGLVEGLSWAAGRSTWTPASLLYLCDGPWITLPNAGAGLLYPCNGLGVR